MERIKLTRFLPVDERVVARHRTLQSLMTTETSNEGQRFIENCTEELTRQNDSNNSDNRDEVTQVDFASFIILYCRGDNNEAIRGPSCTNSLFFFDDLPTELKLEFAKYSTCYLSSDTTENVELEDCLDENNSINELLVMKNTGQLPDLCTSTYPLMISTSLLQKAPTETPTSMPIIQVTKSPTMTPSFITFQPSTTDDSINSGSISTIGVIGIGITIIFAIMLCHQSIILWRNRNNLNSSKKKCRNDPLELQEDGSVVASEHSHELLPTPDEKAEEIDNAVDESTSSRPTLDKTWDALGRSWRSPKQKATKSPKQNLSSNAKKSKVPQQLITENLSDDNPVHTRKRFQYKKGSSQFPFDDVVATPKNNDVTASMNDFERNTEISSTSNKLQINTNLKAPKAQIPAVQQQVYNQVSNPISHAGGKENSSNNMIQLRPKVQSKQPHTSQINVDNIGDNADNHDHQFQAVTFGNVVHTEEIPRNTNNSMSTKKVRSNLLRHQHQSSTYR